MKSPLSRFLYWIEERHKIHLKRQAGEPPPWTKDPVLQSVFFTNPYRENDKTTVWFRENVRDPLRDDERVLAATVIFRWFNRISTGELLLEEGLLHDWDEDAAIDLLEEAPKPVFTGAFMIKAGNGPPGCKIPNVCKSITEVIQYEPHFLEVALNEQRLEALWKEFKSCRNLGGFMSYEIVCDLRYTYLLENATDINTWANPGPGALRGLLRLDGGKPKGRAAKVDQPLEKMAHLLKVVRKKLGRRMPRFELREIEHSLCEFDKYERARTGEGKLKRKYNAK